MFVSYSTYRNSVCSIVCHGYNTRIVSCRHLKIVTIIIVIRLFHVEKSIGVYKIVSRHVIEDDVLNEKNKSK